MRIAVDLLGGDDAPAVVVDGALRAFGADPDLHLLLVGPPEVADELSRRARIRPIGDRDLRPPGPARRSRMADPTPAAVSRADTTVRAAGWPRSPRARPTRSSPPAPPAPPSPPPCSASGRWPGVRRPALVATLPALAGPVVLLDVGGSARGPTGHPGPARPCSAPRTPPSCTASPRPRVGLLSIGTEPGKGDRARRAADPVLAAARPAAGAPATSAWSRGTTSPSATGPTSIVTDGFTGNVLLKGIEGAYAMAGGPPASGGAPRAAALLGVAGTVVVCHGAAPATTSPPASRSPPTCTAATADRSSPTVTERSPDGASSADTDRGDSMSSPMTSDKRRPTDATWRRRSASPSTRTCWNGR